MSQVNRLRRPAAVLIVALLAGVLSLSAWTHAPNWSNADSLFYQSMSFEIDGLAAPAARARVFRSPLAASAIAQEPAVADPRWQNFESQFSRRRWLVPAAAAGIRSLAGARALPDVAIVGYYAFAVTLCLLLLCRFEPLISVTVMALCLALGPARNWGLRPMTDSWGLALEALAILLAGRAMIGQRKSTPLWVVTMLALSLTRDLALVPLGGVAWLTLRSHEPDRRRCGAHLLATGIAATIPAYLVFGASARSTLAFQLSGYQVPIAAHNTWSYILSQYPTFALNNLRTDLSYMAHHPAVGVTFALGLIALFAFPSGRDAWKLLLRGSVVGWLVILALDPDFSHFRYELAALPGVAFGLCVVTDAVRQWLASRHGVTSIDRAAG